MNEKCWYNLTTNIPCRKTELQGMV